jgi:septation ring formation regulator EzrA
MESIKYMIDDDQTIKVQSLEGLLENITRKLSVLPKKSEEKKGTYYSVLNDILNNI